jgi:filamentous hemagglutinin
VNLRPGIALSAEQIAQLTADIVWLVEKEITLPGVNGQPGAVQKALVPQLYAVPHTGDLRPDGALLSGADVQISADGTLNNSGTLLGRKLVQINAGTVNNLLGDIQAQSTSLTATGDINNLGGTISAEQSLSLAAGRDINVATQTSASTNGSRLSERVAGLYVTGAGGSLLASAGRDVNLVASALQSQGSASVQAAGSINLGAVTTSESLHFGTSGEATFHQDLAQTSQTGSLSGNAQ